MKNLAKITTLSLLLFSLALFSSVAKADTLSFVGVNGSVTPSGGEYTGPYTISVDGTDLPLFCLNLDRNMGIGETWTANASQLSSNSSVSDKEAAILFSMANSNQLSNVDAQLEIWAILDPNDALAEWIDTGYRRLNLKGVQFAAMFNPWGQYNDAFYSQFTRFTAVPGSQSSGRRRLRTSSAVTSAGRYAGTELAVSARHGTLRLRRNALPPRSAASKHNSRE